MTALRKAPRPTRHGRRLVRRLPALLVVGLCLLASGPGTAASASTPLATGTRLAAGPGLAAVTTTGTLTTTTPSVVQGDPLTFSFSIPSASKANSENWVGLYSNPGNGPVNQTYVGPSTTYNYVGSALSGTTTFSTGSLTPGSYIAYYLYANGYTWLAQPVTFTVTKAPPATPPTYVTAFGSTGSGSGQLSQPAGVAVDPSGDLWVADTGNNRVVELSPSGSPLTSFSTEACTTPVLGGVDQTAGPQAIAVNGTDVFVVDACNDQVEEYSTAGKLLATIGSAGTGNGQFDGPGGVALDSLGHLWVSDTGNNRVEEFSASTGAYQSSITAGMAGPQGVATDTAGDVWVTDDGDPYGDAVIEYSPTGVQLTSLGSSGETDYGGLVDPSAISVDGKGDVYVAEPDLDLIQEFTTAGRYLAEFGDPSAGAGLLSFPQAVAATPDGKIFVADTGDDRVAEYSAAPAPPASTPETPVVAALPFAALAAGAVALVTRRIRRRTRRRTLEES